MKNFKNGQTVVNYNSRNASERIGTVKKVYMTGVVVVDLGGYEEKFTPLAYTVENGPTAWSKRSRSYIRSLRDGETAEDVVMRNNAR